VLNLSKEKIMIKQSWIDTDIPSLMGRLAGKDGATRQKARKSLVALGKPAVLSLIQALQNSKVDHVRWEAVKTLNAIGDTRAIPPLVGSLEDSNIDVAWLAGEGLSKFKKVAWLPLLRALIKRGSDSAALRQGAHHVLKDQKEDGFNDLLEALSKALVSNSGEEWTPVAASEILRRMKAPA
jgi:HEAT repeat protein